jgi:hypothetical protein
MEKSNDPELFLILKLIHKLLKKVINYFEHIKLLHIFASNSI